MSIAKKLIYFLFILQMIISPLIGIENYKVEYQPKAYEMAISIDNTGILRRADSGLVYLDITNEFVTSVKPLIEVDGKLKPIPTSIKYLGAHIVVFKESENIVPEELDVPFSFEIIDIRSVKETTRNGLTKFWVLTVNAPKLEDLRDKYHCTSKINNTAFQIIIGKQLPTAPKNWEAIDELSSFNFSNESTQGLCTNGDFHVVNNQKILETAAKVDAIGKLHLLGNGYTCLNVANDYIENIKDLLPITGEFKQVSTNPSGIGAHISVFHEDEMIRNEIWELKEGGEWFTFTVKQLRYVDRKIDNVKTRLWVLAVEAPGLERLRKHYGLKPKLHGYDFHITIGREVSRS